MTVTVKDGIGGGNPLSNVAVSFTDNGTELATGTTNGSGVATATYSGDAAGSHTIGASAGGVTITQTQTRHRIGWRGGQCFVHLRAEFNRQRRRPDDPCRRGPRS